MSTDAVAAFLQAAELFSGHDSGLSGRELPPSRWRAYDEAVREFLTSVRDENYVGRGLEGEWYDVHAGHAASLIAEG